MKVETKCKFCHRPIVMEVDQAGFENPAINAKLWLTQVSCNSCANYYCKRKTIGEGIISACVILANARRLGADQKIESAICEKLTSLTKKLAEHVCGFHRLETQWDADMVDTLMRSPEKSSTVLNIYIRGVRIIREQMSQPSVTIKP